MSLFTKCILSPVLLEDGIRVSVMSRHTLRDGRTPDIRINRECYCERLSCLGPPASLVRGWYAGRVSWEDFEKRYAVHLWVLSDVVRHLAQQACKEDISLLCIEETAEYCHRRLLAEECKKYCPELKVVVR